MQIHFIQHVPFESPGYLLQWAEEANHAISFTRTYEAAVFPDADTIALLIVMGGPMGVYDETQFPWLKAEKAFIRTVINAGKKVLGVCLGSQLVAEVLDARVYPNTQKEIGWWPLQVLPAAAGTPTAGWPSEITVFHWHGDTFDLPAGADHLFRTDACPHQGYLVNNQVAGFQFHMEVGAPEVQHMILHCGQELVPGAFIQDPASLEKGVDQYATGTRQYLKRFLDAFLDN
ncbi:MAG: amidotransferase [Candidatus Pseudobacter hemicellulosilyticus]|uniref:Amidotransferase n=1 Tax=Candidatus Pseudobacter hemicellulosilyticus TaxID=3121375 RepID=A0AAJ6BIL9_9BACT|nr:MAG: amidotransferase [Pseudobacter sp.]